MMKRRGKVVVEYATARANYHFQAFLRYGLRKHVHWLASGPCMSNLENRTAVDSVQDRKHHIALVDSGKVSGRDCFSWSVTDVMGRRKDIHSKFS
jgi:hypothetical protein